MRHSKSILRLIDAMRGAIPLARRVRSISFAQYGEDLLFSFFHPKKNGFYVDVGAYHPWKDSNTYKLYLRGWSGLTIEPNPDLAPLFQQFRPRDTHLTLGVSSEPSELEYYRYTDPKLNTFVPNLKGPQSSEQRVERIKCLPLRDILAQWRPEYSIDLLSIDCEGLNFEVVTSIDLKLVRPVCIIVEDDEQFFLSMKGTSVSKIRQHLIENEYALISQGLFSFVYVDQRALSNRENQRAFYFNAIQF